MEERAGMLYLCATPIGNLEDVTLRVLRVLREADAVWAEDTRRTAQLLNHYEIKKPLTSCHAHNEAARAEELARALREGKTIAYCSDAGMPGISDPGARLTARCIEEGLAFTVLPGPSAALNAAVMSGIPFEAFSFFGFLPRQNKRRRAMLDRIRRCEQLILLYESPRRVPALLQELYRELGDRPAALLREMTKLHEECLRGTLAELCARITEPVRGECVVAVAAPQTGAAPPVGAALPAPAAPLAAAAQQAGGAGDEQLRGVLERLLRDGFSTKDAARAAAAALGVPKKKAYATAVFIQDSQK